MGKLTVNWERSIYDDDPHEFVRELATFLTPVLREYDCAAMLGMLVQMGDDDWQSRQQFRQFCRNGAAVEWLRKEIALMTDQAFEKWNNGDFAKGASDDGEE